MVKQIKYLIQSMVYAPWKIARLMDKHGAKLLMESIDLLLTLETDCEKIFLPNTILCSSGLIEQVRKIVEAHANTTIPYRLLSLPAVHGQGEVVSFDTPTVVKLHLQTQFWH
jgi:hypothetical protein